jgi:hypothetical protein
MRRNILRALGIVFAACPAVVFAQSPKAATYITDDEVKELLKYAPPAVDQTIRVVDIGNEHLAVGIIHRGPTGGARGSGAGAGAASGAGRGSSAGAGAAAEPCGEQAATPPSGGVAGGIAHDSQTEGYVIVSGGGTLITGGHIVNGRKSPSDSEVTKVLNGPSCSGTIGGQDVVRRQVKTGDVIIIPAGVPHGWTDITDHVNYLSIRPSDHILEAGYVNPHLKK